MVKRVLFGTAFAASFAAAAACTVHKTAVPSLTGPSEFSLSVGITANPDSINQDGGSQSSIRVTAHDVNGQPIGGQSFRLDLLVNGTQVDFGRLSARTIVTGSDGVAFATFTAPPASPAGATVASCSTFNTGPGSLAGQCVDVAATPIGNDFASSQTQSAEIRLMPVGLIIPPAQTPTASFTTSPAQPTPNLPVIFDGSGSCAGQLTTTGTGSSAVTSCDPNGRSITSYLWNFGDGSTGTGLTASHSYTQAQTYSATLTVTNSDGGTNTAAKAVTIGTVSNPTAAFTISPVVPAAGLSVPILLRFNADSSSAASGHHIVEFSWDYGDGNGDSGAALFATSHNYTVPSSADGYTVSLTILDDAGGKATTSQKVKIN